MGRTHPRHPSFNQQGESRVTIPEAIGLHDLPFPSDFGEDVPALLGKDDLYQAVVGCRKAQGSQILLTVTGKLLEDADRGLQGLNQRPGAHSVS